MARNIGQNPTLTPALESGNNPLVIEGEAAAAARPGPRLLWPGSWPSTAG